MVKEQGQGRLFLTERSHLEKVGNGVFSGLKRIKMILLDEIEIQFEFGGV